MLTAPDNLFFLHLLRDDVQNELFHHLSRDGGEADRPVAPRVLLLALFEDWNDIGFPQVLRHFSCFLLPDSVSGRDSPDLVMKILLCQTASPALRRMVN